MGKLTYLIGVWGGTTSGNLNALQRIQNRAARLVNRNWKASTVENLKAIGWLSINQLVFYHTVSLMFKVKMCRTVGGPTVPQSLLDMFSWEYGYNTRQAEEEKIRPMGNPKLEVTKRGFRYRAAEYFNRLPKEIVNADKEKSFKFKVRNWIKENVTVKA